MYLMQLDMSTGTWVFYLDGQEKYRSAPDLAWKNSTGDRLQFMGEVVNYEDDMPGTEHDSCAFAGCMFKTAQGGYNGAFGGSFNRGTDDSDEWGIDTIDDFSFYIWDKKPLPVSRGMLPKQ